MALKATIFKAALQIADMDRGYYADHALTIARHPSETDERMMLRVLAFAFEGRRYDCGSKLGYLEATVEFALKHPQLGRKFADYLARRVAAGLDS